MFSQKIGSNSHKEIETDSKTAGLVAVVDPKHMALKYRCHGIQVPSNFAAPMVHCSMCLPLLVRNHEKHLSETQVSR